MSDLHLETPQARPTYNKFEIQPHRQYLALLGDIGKVSDPQFFTFLEEQLQKFKVVFYLLGNHEPYGTTLPAARLDVRAFERDIERRRAKPGSTIGKFVFLDRTRFDLTDSVTVLGCTLFSHITPEQQDTVAHFVSDFSYIEDWTVASHCAAHHVNLEWLNAQVAHIKQREPHRLIVIFTHYSPTMSKAANDPKHIKDPAEVRSAFVTDLSNQLCWTSSRVRLWAFGHTHFNCDFEDPQTGKRVLANQKGYSRSESMMFCAMKLVSFGTSAQAGDRSLHRERRWKASKHDIKRCIIL